MISSTYWTKWRVPRNDSRTLSRAASPMALARSRITKQKVDRLADGDQVSRIIDEAAGFAVDDLILDAPDATGDNRP